MFVVLKILNPTFEILFVFFYLYLIFFKEFLFWKLYLLAHRFIDFNFFK